MARHIQASPATAIESIDIFCNPAGPQHLVSVMYVMIGEDRATIYCRFWFPRKRYRRESRFNGASQHP